MSQLLIRDLQTQSPGSSLVILYELEMPDGSTFYFHDGKDSSSADITFDGNTYESIPVEFDGVDLTSDGPSSRPTLKLGNVLTVFKEALGSGFTYEDLLGKKFTRRRTLEKYLTSSPAVELPKNIYYVDRIGTTNIISVELELASPFDIEGVKLPSRTIMGGGCSWQYQGASPDLAANVQLGGCTWNRFSTITIPGTNITYTNYVNVKDEPVVTANAVVGLWTGSGTVNAIYRTVQSGLTKIENNGGFTTGVSANNYWQMVTSTTSTPTDLNVAWRRVWIHTPYSASGTYNVYTDPNYNDYVTYTLTGETSPRLFKKILVTQASSSEGSVPAYNKHWDLGDVCGKRLYSCTRRFQFKQATSNTVNVPSTVYDQTIILPFGGFPGSRTYS
jgi:lambda family phage minor tail protein L